MTFYDFSIIGTLSATFAVACVYFFLFSLYRQTYLGMWAVFWLIHFVTQIFYRVPLDQISTAILIAIQIISTANFILFVFATSKFLGRTMHKGWYYWGIGLAILSDIAAYFDASFIIKAAPSILFVAYVYFWHGWMFLRHLDSKSIGKTIVGLASIGIGVHTLDMPFLVSVSWFVPWGFVISGTLRFIIAIGTLMLYVEKNFRDLVAKEQQYRLLAENAADTIYLYKVKPTYSFEYIGPSITKLTGYSVNEFYDSPDLLFSLVHPNDAFVVENLVKDPTSAAVSPIIMRLIRRDHTVIWVEQTTVPILDEDQSCISFEGIIRDISARKALEEDVSRLDRLNTVGQMAANVAHEIRNPMTTVKGYLQFFIRKPAFAGYLGHFNLLISEIDRADLIIKEYLSLCKNRSQNRKACQLNDIIQEIYPLIKAAANALSMDVDYQLGASPELHLDEKEIRQLILNLVRNGMEAMKCGGTVTLRTYTKEDEVILAVVDQGDGIPQNILDNIGKPFMTTKENGTGLGLAVVYRIAHDHHARIQVKTSQQGTSFYIIFKTK